MDDDKNKWRDFQKLTFDSKAVARRAKKVEKATLRHAHKFVLRRLDNLADIRHRVMWWLGGVATLILTVGLQQLWLQQSYSTLADTDSGAYAEATLGDIKTLNPLYATSSSEISATRLIFSSLFSYDTTGHLQGDLARSIQVGAKKPVYTVTLKPGVRWHDDRRLTTKDVAFTINLIKNPDVRSSLRLQWQDVNVKVLDEERIEFSLPSNYAPFPHALTFAILPEHILGTVAPSALREHTFSVSPVGSGPFSLRLLQTEQRRKIVNMLAFSDYFKGRPKLERFEIHAFQNPNDIKTALKTGQVNAAVDVQDIRGLSQKNFRVKNYGVNDGVYVFFNTSQPALRDVNVRRALQRAIDMQALRKAVAPKQEPLDTPFVNGQREGHDDIAIPNYNEKVAAVLLERAGWKLKGQYRTKAGQRLVINIAAVNQEPYVSIVRQLENYWSKVGVSAQKTLVDTSDQTQDFVGDIIQPRAYDVLINELSIGADPDVYAYWHSSQVGARGLNLSNYANDTVDDALASARSRSEPALRQLKYSTFTKQWLKDVPAIGLFQSDVQYVARNRVESLTPGQVLVSPYDRYANVIYWTTGQSLVYKTP